jgi:hypothetical protein
MMKNWEDMTDGERDARQVQAWEDCSDLLRRAMRDNDVDLADAKTLVEAQMVSDQAEYTLLMKRGARSRATRLDREVTERAASECERLGFDMGMLWDVEL